MIHVLHINSNYLTSKLHENLLERLESMNTHNTVFMPIKKETKEDFLYESQYEVYHPVTFRDIDKFIFTFKQRKIYQKLQQVINPQQYDIIHAHTLFTDGNVAYRLNKEYGIPYIVAVRGFTDIDEFFNKRINLRKRGRQILKNASQIIFLSETNRQELLNNYIKNESLKKEIMEKSKIIPNGIDAKYIENKGQPKKLDLSKPLKFIQVGQIRERKNGVRSVKAIKELMNKTGVQAELSFVGKIVDNNYAEQLIEEGEGFVSLHPPVEVQELIDIYRKNDIFIMPSLSETFGLVYPEAMSQGLPVLYTKGQGFDGQYEDGYVGYAVHSNNIQDIVEKIQLIIKDYEKISLNALNAYEKFNWDNLSKKYIKIYSKLTNLSK